MCDICNFEKKNVCNCKCEPSITECLIKNVECIWKKAFCDAIIIPCINTPLFNSYANGPLNNFCNNPPLCNSCGNAPLCNPCTNLCINPCPCVVTITHTLGNCVPRLTINGLLTNSPLANNAFYSFEVSCGKWLNLYEIQLPNIAGQCGCKSSGEVYTEALVKLGISIDGDGYKWKGSCPNTLVIFSKAIGMNPIDFSKKQITAIKTVIEYFLSKPCCN